MAASLKLAPVVVVFCDNSLNRIELKQMARQHPSRGTRVDPADVAMLAHAMGCDGANVDSVRGLEAALAAPRSQDRPPVIGATIAPSQYAAQFRGAEFARDACGRGRRWSNTRCTDSAPIALAAGARHEP